MIAFHAAFSLNLVFLFFYTNNSYLRIQKKLWRDSEKPFGFNAFKDSNKKVSREVFFSFIPVVRISFSYPCLHLTFHYPSIDETEMLFSISIILIKVHEILRLRKEAGKRKNRSQHQNDGKGGFSFHRLLPFSVSLYVSLSRFLVGSFSLFNNLLPLFVKNP